MRLNFTAAVLAAGSLWAAGPAQAQPIELLVPAYFYPSFDPAQSQWDEMGAALARGVKVTAIMNPNSGPGIAFNSDYLAAVNTFRAAGGRVLGYVYTCYGNNNCVNAPGIPPTRSVDEVLADAQAYRQWYPVDGIFLDEVSGSDATRAFYAEATQRLRALDAGWQLVGNPGAAIPEATAALLDTVVTFEQGGGSYDNASSEAWMDGAVLKRQAHLHHSVAGAAAMQSLVAQAAARRAGFVYVTDDLLDNPFDRLPTYWDAEVLAVATLNAVPEPATAASLLGGLALLAAIRRRRARPGLPPAG